MQVGGMQRWPEPAGRHPGRCGGCAPRGRGTAWDWGAQTAPLQALIICSTISAAPRLCSRDCWYRSLCFSISFSWGGVGQVSVLGSLAWVPRTPSSSLSVSPAPATPATLHPPRGLHPVYLLDLAQVQGPQAGQWLEPKPCVSMHVKSPMFLCAAL